MVQSRLDYPIRDHQQICNSSHLIDLFWIKKNPPPQCSKQIISTWMESNKYKMKNRCLKVLRVLLIKSYKVTRFVSCFTSIFTSVEFFTTFQNFIQHCPKKYFYHKYCTFNGFTLTPSYLIPLTYGQNRIPSSKSEQF